MIVAELTHIPLGLEIVLIALLALIAFCGSAIVVKGIFDSAKKIEDDKEEPEYEDIWTGYEPAEQSYAKRPVPDVKPMSVLDWLSRRQS